MRSALLRCVIVAALAAMLGGHITELFDQWDHTLRTGRDADYTVVLIAACAGAAFIAGKSSRFLQRFVRVVAGVAARVFCVAVMYPVTLKTFAFDLSPPPILAPIRI